MEGKHGCSTCTGPGGSNCIPVNLWGSSQGALAVTQQLWTVFSHKFLINQQRMDVLSNRYPAHSITGQSATEWTSTKNGIIYYGVLLLRAVFPPTPRNQPIRWQPGCTRAGTCSLNTRQNFARAHIIELICACAAVSIRRAI